MPPDRDIEFIIELIPGTGHIAQRPYSMNLSELVELKKQLDAMLATGLISTKCIAMEITSVIHRQERWRQPSVHRLPKIE